MFNVHLCCSLRLNSAYYSISTSDLIWHPSLTLAWKQTASRRLCNLITGFEVQTGDLSARDTKQCKATTLVCQLTVCSLSTSENQ